MPLVPTKRNATYQDVLDAPEHMRAELIDGDLYLQSRPNGSHQLALSNLRDEILRHDRDGRKGDWVLLHRVELSTPDILAPDIAGWRRPRFKDAVDSPHYYFTVVPDWVCEVLSPSTRAYDRGIKASKYLRAGVRHMWLVDPEERSLEVFSASEDAWSLLDVYTERDTFCAPPFGGEAWIELGRLWDP